MKLKLPSLQKKTLIKLVAAILAVIILLVLLLGSCGKKTASKASAEYTPYTVTRGDITVSVTGSGTVQPIEQYEIQSLVSGDILEDYVSEGATIEKDQILYVIDSESALNSIERSEASYEQQLISYNDRVKSYNEAEANRSVRSPIDGVITQMYVENGDEINAGTKICEITNTSLLTVRIPFLASNAKEIYKNQAATVYIDERNESHTGYVSHVATGSYATEAGAIVSDVEITFTNPGAILPGEIVTATVGNFACNDTGTIEEAETEIITAKVSGDAESLNFGRGDKVSAGNLILKIVNDSSSSDLRSSELSLKNSKLSLDDQLEKLNDYTIRSPITGTVISKTMKAGDTLDGNKSSLAIVADMSKLTFEISVDELYIRNIEVGQTVSVTADAVPNRTFEGVVDTVSIIGSASSGVTVYPVTVVISEYEGLLPGMNVDAKIVISDASDVLMIPVNSVTRGNLVLVDENADISGITNKPEAGTDSSKKDDMPEFDPENMPPPEGFKRGDMPELSEEDFKKFENGKMPELSEEDLKKFANGERPDFGDRARPERDTVSDNNTKNEEDNKTQKGTSSKNNTGKQNSEIRLPEAPDGYKYVMIETGEANDDYVEVVSGLSEGDVIYVVVIKNTAASQQSAFGMGGRGGMPGGMGGMPGGGMSGMPSGGMGGMPSGGNRPSGMSGSSRGNMGGMR